MALVITQLVQGIQRLATHALPTIAREKQQQHILTPYCIKLEQARTLLQVLPHGKLNCVCQHQHTERRQEPFLVAHAARCHARQWQGLVGVPEVGELRWCVSLDDAVLTPQYEEPHVRPRTVK